MCHVNSSKHHENSMQSFYLYEMKLIIGRTSTGFRIPKDTGNLKPIPEDTLGGVSAHHMAQLHTYSQFRDANQPRTHVFGLEGGCWCTWRKPPMQGGTLTGTEPSTMEVQGKHANHMSP